ncbi:hypothetical protein ACVMH6_006946 [Rhizobium leguminosarum]
METAVDSKLIEAITYDDEDSRHLRVYLTNGQRREYEGVPKGVVVGLTMAESPGNFYMKAIRGKYPPRP